MRVREWLDGFHSRGVLENSGAAKRRGGASRRIAARSSLAVRKCGLEQLEERRLLSINLICKNLELVIGDSGSDIGKVTGVYQCVNGSPTGANLLSNPWSEPFAYVKVGSNATQSPTSFTYTGNSTSGDLTFGFANPTNSLTVHVDQGTAHDYFTFNVTALSSLPDTLKLLNFSTTLTSHVSRFGGTAANDTFAMYVRSLTPAGTATSSPFQVVNDVPSHMVVQTGVVGTSFALGGCDYGTNGSGILADLATLITDKGLVTSSVGGPSALGASINQQSYLFAVLTSANVDEWISSAKTGGIDTILITGWWQTLGHYVPNSNFPGGLNGGTYSLTWAVDRIHAAGLNVGLHCLTGYVGTSDSYVASGDSGLGKDYSYPLASGITSTATTLTVTGQIPVGLLVTNYLQIGTELIQYTSYAINGSNTVFSGLTRGVFGSTPAAHSAEASVGHLKSYDGAFCADPDSTLLDAITTNLANVMNTCGADAIYLDGAEFGLNSYGVSKTKADIVDKISKAVRVEASVLDAYSWTYNSVVGAWDFANWGEKLWVDAHASFEYLYMEDSLQPIQLGWFGPHASGVGYDSLSLDEMEYLCAKARAYDYSLSLECFPPLNGRQSEFLAMWKNWQTVTIDAAMKARLAVPGDEFHLETLPDGSLHIVQVKYATQKADGATAGSTSWTVDNTYGTQYPTMRIQALSGVGSYTGTSTTLTGTQSDVTATTVSANTGVTGAGVSWAASPNGTLPYTGYPNTSFLTFTAHNTSASQTAAWAKASRVYSSDLNIGTNGAIGVWIYGDQQGEIINLQPFAGSASSPTVLDDHYITVDFSGWKYFELALSERDVQLYGNYTWPYSLSGALYKSRLPRNPTTGEISISGINIYYNNIPVSQTATCSISLVKALPIADVTLTNPAVTIGSTTITFPVTLTSERYIEFNSMTDCKYYSKDGALLGSITPTGTLSTLAQDANSITFSGTPQSGYSVRANVTIATYDVQSANWDAATVSSWSFEEASGTTALDASAYQNNGTLSANVTRVAGRYGNGLQFNGTDTSVTISNSTSLSNVTGSFTVELWFKYSGDGTAGKAYWTLLNKNASGDGNGDPFHIFVTSGTNYLCARVGNGSTYYNLNSLVNVNDGALHQVALVYDDTTKIYTLYVDGSSKKTQSGGTGWTIAKNTAPVTLGYWPAYVNYFNGAIDEVQILNRPLSLTEVQNRYNYTTYTPPTVTVQPTNQAVDPGQTATFVVEATGQGALTYHWLKNGANIVGATGAYYTTPTTSSTNNGDQYSAIITNDYGSVISSVATLYVNDGLQAWWKLDETGTTTTASDASGNGHTGTLTNFPTTPWTSGIINNALTFDGVNDYVSVPAPTGSSLKYTGAEMTISAWAYINSSETTGGYLVSKAWNGNGYYNYRLRVTPSGTVTFYVGGQTSYSIASTATLSTGAWHLITATVDATKAMALYVDGVSVATGTHTITTWVPTDGGDANLPLAIGTLYPYGGGWAGNTSFSFDGKLDNVRFYTHALSAEAIAEQARAPVGYWKFNETTGVDASDSSGNGYTGTRVNGPIWTSRGKFDGALAFDGLNDYVSVPSPAGSALEYTGGELTVSAWAYINPSETTGGFLISKAWNGSGYYNYWLKVNPTKTVTFYVGGQGASGPVGYSIASTATLSTGTWHRISGTVDAGGAMELYFDGDSVATGTRGTPTSWVPASGNGGDASLPLAIGTLYPYGGGWAGNTSFSFDGKLDSVRIFNQALSLSEVQMLRSAIIVAPEIESVAVDDGTVKQSSIASLAAMFDEKFASLDEKSASLEELLAFDVIRAVGKADCAISPARRWWESNAAFKSADTLFAHWNDPLEDLEDSVAETSPSDDWGVEIAMDRLQTHVETALLAKTG